MGKLNEYLDRAKDLAEEAGDVAKNFAGDVVNRAKDLSDERDKVKELAQSAREQTAALSLGAREKMQGVLQDAKASKEIKQGIAELEALPEFEGSIIYSMEVGTMINELRSLMLFVSDDRLDDASVIEEIHKVMGKVEPAVIPQVAGATAGGADQAADAAQPSMGEPAGDAAQALEQPAADASQASAQNLTDEDLAIERAKTIAYSACTRALATFSK